MPEQKRGLLNRPAILTFLAIISSVELIRMSLFITFLPSFLLKMGYDTASLGLVISVNLLADNLVKSASGWLVDHKGPWPVLFGGSLMVLTGVILIMYFYSNILFLVLASILVGLGASPTWPASIAGAIQTAGEEKRATIISLISVVWLAGGGLGSILMGFLIDERNKEILQRLRLPMVDAYQTGFYILIGTALYAITVCILGWLSWYRVPHIKEQLQRTAKPKNKFREIVRRLWLVKGLIPGMFFQTLSLGVLIPNMLPYAMLRFGLTESQYSLLLLVGGAVVIAFMVPIGHLVDKLGSKKFLVTGFSLAAMMLLVLVQFGNKQNIWLIVALLGLAYALIQPAWNSLLAGAIPPRQRGVLMGLFMSVEGLGFGVGPLVGGLLGALSNYFKWAGNGFGLATPFYFSSVSLALMAVVYLLYPIHQYQIEGD